MYRKNHPFEHTEIKLTEFEDHADEVPSTLDESDSGSNVVGALSRLGQRRGVLYKIGNYNTTS